MRAVGERSIEVRFILRAAGESSVHEKASSENNIEVRPTLR